MAISKRPNGYEVYVYDPSIRRKRYVGVRKNLRGAGGAQELEREKAAEFSGNQPVPDEALTIRGYAAEWVDLHHGEGTRRLSPSTRRHNQHAIRPFLDAYGDRALDGLTRREALKWARLHAHNAKVVSALFNDAVDDDLCKANPFANRRQEQSRERKQIAPITEDELDRIAAIALRHWGSDGYGLVARAWVMFAGWVGCRPGETFSVTRSDLDFARGEVKVRRVKRRGGAHPTDTVVFPQAAQDAIRAMPSIPATGPVFLSVQGRPIGKGGMGYYWTPIRAAFRQTVTEERWRELLDEQDDLEFYSLRHFCGSVMADRGLTEADIAHQLGNSVRVCRETYIHSYRDRTNDRVRAALQAPQAVVDLNSRRKDTA